MPPFISIFRLVHVSEAMRLKCFSYGVWRAGPLLFLCVFNLSFSFAPTYFFTFPPAEQLSDLGSLPSYSRWNVPPLTRPSMKLDCSSWNLSLLCGLRLPKPVSLQLLMRPSLRGLFPNFPSQDSFFVPFRNCHVRAIVRFSLYDIPLSASLNHGQLFSPFPV